MYIEDLSTESRGPSSANIWSRELERDHPGLVTRSVGWLGNWIPTSGSVDPVIIDALEYYSRWAYVEDGFMGVHTCEMCNASHSHGEYWIIWAGVRYVLPQMTLHYIADHGYKPPDAFLNHVRDKWTTEGRLTTDFPYGRKAQDRKLAALAARESPIHPERKAWWQFW